MDDPSAPDLQSRACTAPLLFESWIFAFRTTQTEIPSFISIMHMTGPEMPPRSRSHAHRLSLAALACHTDVDGDGLLLGRTRNRERAIRTHDAEIAVV